MAKAKAAWSSKIKDKEYFEALTHPRFLEVKGLILFETHYTSESFELWENRLGSHSSPDDSLKTENTINHVHLDELVSEENLQIEIGEHLQKVWKDVLHSQFPRYEFECKVKHFKGGWELVLWRKRP